MKFLDQLYEGHVEMNGQIVCCKGVNDGKELERTMDDLSKYLPFMRSVSVVPGGYQRSTETNLIRWNFLRKKRLERLLI